jgi:hypothetical protein
MSLARANSNKDRQRYSVQDFMPERRINSPFYLGKGRQEIQSFGYAGGSRSACRSRSSAVPRNNCSISTSFVLIASSRQRLAWARYTSASTGCMTFKRTCGHCVPFGSACNQCTRWVENGPLALDHRSEGGWARKTLSPCPSTQRRVSFVAVRAESRCLATASLTGIRRDPENLF